MFYAELNELLTRELAEDGYSGVEVRVTPMRTEIIIRATRTQNVLGERRRAGPPPGWGPGRAAAAAWRRGIDLGPCCPAAWRPAARLEAVGELEAAGLGQQAAGRGLWQQAGGWLWQQWRVEGQGCHRRRQVQRAQQSAGWSSVPGAAHGSGHASS